jgi:hypothetical protein
MVAKPNIWRSCDVVYIEISFNLQIFFNQLIFSNTTTYTEQ